MTYVLVRLTVEDLAKWRPVFEEAGELRKSFGSKGVHVFSTSANPNEIVILGEYEDNEKAREMFQSQEFRDGMKRAGITGMPDVTLLDEVVKLAA